MAVSNATVFYPSHPFALPLLSGQGLTILVAAITVLIGENIFAYRDRVRDQQSHREEIRVSSLEMGTDTLDAVLVDAERGSDRFLITGEESHLAPYRLARENAGNDYSTIAALAVTPASTDRVRRLKPLIDEELTEMGNISEFGQYGNPDRTLAIASAQRSKELIDQLHQFVSEIKADEQQQLRILRIAVEREHTLFRIVTLCAGGVIAMLLTIAVVTIRRDAEVARDVLQATMRSIGAGIIATDLEGRVTFINSAASAMIRRLESETIGAPLATVFKVFDEKTGSSCEKFVKGTLGPDRAGKAQDAILVAADGRESPIEVISAPIRHNSGPPLGCVIGFRDTKERREREKQIERARLDLAQSNTVLRQRNADLEQFAYAASHDMREPLRTIAIFSDLLGRQTPSTPEIVQYKRYVESAVRQMQVLVDGLLAYAVAMGRMHAPHEPASMQMAFDTAVSSLRAAIEESGASVTATPLPMVRGDQAQLAQLLQNLIGNAIKYRSEQPPRIHLSAEQKDRKFIFHVKDNGIGFDSQQAKNIFGLFKRLHSSSRYPGAGIGLAVCKRIVQLHDGAIWAQSKPGEGSVFSFSLPADVTA